MKSGGLPMGPGWRVYVIDPSLGSIILGFR